MLRLYQAGGCGCLKKVQGSADGEAGGVAEQIEEPYKICIANGMTPEQFWNSTMDEICVYMECVRNKEECKFNDLHYLASLVRVAVVSAFDSQVKVPTWNDVASGNTESAEKSNIYNGWEDSKAYMMAIRNHRR